MRPRSVRPKAYVFDFDDTLVKTQAQVHVLRDGKKIKSLTPEEYNVYKEEPGETFDMSDFADPRIIFGAEKYKSWAELENVDRAIKFGKANAVIYILTARAPAAQIPIHTFLKRNNITIPLNNVITIGNDKGKWVNIPEEKEKVLKVLAGMYDVYFFDVSEDNIKMATKIPGVNARLIDWKK